jgi:methionyl-tRNA synthetase
MEHISIDEFKKVEARIGTVLAAEGVEGSEKLIKLSLDFGEDAPRQILSGIRQWYTPESLIGKQLLISTIHCHEHALRLEPHHASRSEIGDEE